MGFTRARRPNDEDSFIPKTAEIKG